MKTSRIILIVTLILVFFGGIVALVFFSPRVQTQLAETQPTPCSKTQTDLDGDCLENILDYFSSDPTR